MTKKEIKNQLIFYLDYLKLEDKTLKINYECVNKLMNELCEILSTNLKIDNITSFYCWDAIFKEEDECMYTFYLPCSVFMQYISFELKLIIVIFKDSDIEYTF